MPLLGLSEQWLDPDVPFAHGPGIGFGRVVGPYPLSILLIAMPSYAPTAQRGGALVAEFTRATDPGWGRVDATVRARAVAQETQGLTTRTGVGIRCRVVAEVLIPELSYPVADLGQGEVGTHLLLLDGHNVGTGAVLGIASHLSRLKFP